MSLYVCLPTTYFEFFTAVREGFQSLWYWFEQKMNLSRWNDSEISSSDLKARYATLAPQDKDLLTAVTNAVESQENGQIRDVFCR